MFKVGDIVRYSYNGREFPDDPLLVVDRLKDGTYNLKSLKRKDFSFLSDNMLILDLNYQKMKDRRKKLDKICSKLTI
jgi:hypothetical protein